MPAWDRGARLPAGRLPAQTAASLAPCRVQVVEEIYDPEAARVMGFDRVGQASALGCRGVGPAPTTVPMEPCRPAVFPPAARASILRASLACQCADI